MRPMEVSTPTLRETACRLNRQRSAVGKHSGLLLLKVDMEAFTVMGGEGTEENNDEQCRWE